MSEFDIAFEKVRGLVDTFQSNISHYKTSKYSEDQARKDFIDKFWIALGWDVNHDWQTNPYEQEVKVERPIATKGSQRRADYAFYLAPNYHDVKFLVEAKKPFVEVGTAENYFQLIRYAWNSDTPLAALTDFEQFHILDCRFKPDINSALNRAVGKYHFTDYTKRDKFGEIYWLFSREAVADGSIEKRAKELPKPRGRAVQRGLFPGGYQSIDESFLDELDVFRKSLARNFKNHNPQLDSETLTELAQRTIDRLVFLRFLEDKGIEPQRLVENFGTKGTVWQGFIEASRRLDGIYNGIIYRGHTILDGADFKVEDKPFADICDHLAHVNTPYDFNAIPIHILGSIYERFLGKVIVATAKRAKVTEKPEVRKAGGVYYTPQYIVRYIVEHTVGKLIAGKTPDQIAKMRFADIACGSGSFLLGIFDQLLKYHGRYYNENPGKARKGDCIKRDGKLFLSLAKKREILLNNVYGVDIDAQAVEVCQLSLYLKLLEDETEATAQQYLLDFAHVDRMKKLLPDLSKNIRCGNSLIGPDFYENQQADLFDDTETRRINAFDWESKKFGFGKIMAQGGFDAVIGNPPYVKLHNIDKKALPYFFGNYETAEKKCDLYAFFIERVLKVILSSKGILGYITSNTWLNLDSFTNLRKIIAKRNRLIKVVTLNNPFKGVSVSPVLFFVEKGQAGVYDFEIVNYDISTQQVGEMRLISSETIQLPGYIIDLTVTKQTKGILSRLESCSEPLVELAKLQYGIMSANNKRFVISKPQGDYCKPLLSGEDIRRFHIDWPGNRYIDYQPSEMKKKKTARPGEPERFEQEEKIVFQRYSSTQVIASLDTEKFYTLGTTIIGHSISLYSNKYILGIVNSRLLSWWYSRCYTSPTNYIREFEQLPIRTIDFDNKDDKANHNLMVELVERMLELNKKLHEKETRGLNPLSSPLSEHERELLERQIDYTNRKINKLVYELYNLTDDEIKIVEGN